VDSCDRYSVALAASEVCIHASKDLCSLIVNGDDPVLQIRGARVSIASASAHRRRSAQKHRSVVVCLDEENQNENDTGENQKEEEESERAKNSRLRSGLLRKSATH